METRRTVWILGSGFSRSLGGPMLPQLLSYSAFDDAIGRYPDVFKGVIDEMAQAVRFLYHYGTRFAQGRTSTSTYPGSGQLLWEHAEEFMSQLDAAAADETGPAAKRFVEIANDERIHKPGKFASLSELRGLARRVAAIQCTSFVVDSHLGSERWRPYRDWVGSLTNDDTIITFNYDPVLEKLDGGDGRLRFPVPGPDLKPSEPETRQVDVYKLHGSVNWKREGRTITAQADWEFGAKCNHNELAIATPGVSKHTAVNELFLPLWAMAKRAVEQADEIRFLGYRFPPSDAYAREQILGALWRNRREIGVGIVLGPNVHDESIVRLEKMLRWTIASAPVPRNSGVETFPLYAEDYLTIWRLDSATRAHRGEPPDE